MCYINWIYPKNREHFITKDTSFHGVTTFGCKTLNIQIYCEKDKISLIEKYQI